MKKICSVLLILTLILSLSACKSTEVEMEEHFVCDFRLSLYGDYPDYTLEDFGDLGLTKLESYPNPAVYDLYGTYTDRQKIRKAFKALDQMEQVRKVTLKCEMYRVPKGSTAYPSLERPCTYEPYIDGNVYDGRISVSYNFDDAAYNNLLSLEDFKDMPIEACVLNYSEDEAYGYINLYEYGEEPFRLAAEKVGQMPYSTLVQRYIDGRGYADG